MDTNQVNGFFDELQKIAQDDRITKDRFLRFLRAGAVGAAGAGLGYGTGRLVGNRLENALVRHGVKAGPAKLMKYLVPTIGGLGAASMMARAAGTKELMRKVKGDDRNIDKAR